MLGCLPQQCRVPSQQGSVSAEFRLNRVPSEQCCLCRNALEDPWEEAKEDMYTRSVSPEQAPDTATYLDLEFEGGNPVAIDGQQLSPASLLTKLNKVSHLYM